MAEKLKMMSDDIIQENIDYIAERFPNALKEVKDENGKLTRKIDFDVLKQELSSVIIDDKQERYQMTWPDKKKSILLANSKINATLRPIKEKSVDFDNTKNLYIEGDNLDVLKLLRETYLGKVKMIYIDPPYNTGNDFIYEDDFAQSAEDYLANSGQFDEQGNRLISNNESNGRFHTDWLNMMYPRLKLARDILTNDGLILISIDENEIENLYKICDEIFGQNNYIGTFLWNKTATPPSLSRFIRRKYEYILCYGKLKNSIKVLNGGLSEGGDMPLLNGSNAYNTLKFKPESVEFRIPDGIYKKGQYDRVMLEEDIKIEKGKSISDLIISGNFKWSQETLNEEIKKGTIFRIKSEKFAIRYERSGERIKIPANIINKEECGVGTNEDGAKELLSLFGSKTFDFPKPVSLIKYLIGMVNYNNGIFMDFFSGSATLAEAIQRKNFEDNGKRNYILVQIPEKIDNGDYVNLCELGEERIRRAGKKIKEESGLQANDLDIGFRVLKLDSSNMTDVYYNSKAYTQSLLDDTISNIKEGRTGLDLLFQVMLELGVELSAKIEEKTISGKQCFVVNENDIVACFDTEITDEIIKELASIHPLYAVFRDASFASDSANINCEQIFKSISPSTIIKVI